jgi:hypothetical protein
MSDWVSVASLRALPIDKKTRLARYVREEKFLEYVSSYDERTYPPNALEDFRVAFGAPELVTAETISRALRWKYGKHLRNGQIPKHQREVIQRVAEIWPDYVSAGAPLQEAGFAWWRNVLPPTSYITYSFLMHLRSPSRVPIIDQHNFRAVHHYLDRARLAIPDEFKGRTPRRWEHITLIADFISVVRDAWPNGKAGGRPSAHDVDRFLMMRGKALTKNQHV